MTILTKNFADLQAQVEAHVAADAIVQGSYWDGSKGCFIGCLAHSGDPKANEDRFGLPIMVQRIAENIFEALSADDAKAFFAALPDAVGRDGKDLSRVGWQFLEAELRALSPQEGDVKAAIDTVIGGIAKLARGGVWDSASAAVAAHAARAAASAAAAYADSAYAYAAAHAARAAASAAAAPSAAAYADAADAAYAAYAAAHAARAAASAAAAPSAAAHAARAAAYAVAAAHAAADAAYAAVRLRQRDTLLRLISEAPIVETV